MLLIIQQCGLMKDKRPVYLNLLTMRFPVTAIASIAHRMSGVINFLAIPFLVGVLGCSLEGPAQFDKIRSCLHMPIVLFLVWASLAALTYHILAGLRHLVADFEIGESLLAARASAYFVFALSAVLIILEGYWLWS